MHSFYPPKFKSSLNVKNALNVRVAYKDMKYTFEE